MKRDCGIGELIPVAYEVVSCHGQSDDESVMKFVTLGEATACYDSVVPTVKAAPYSDVRLYAKDRQGYMNCIKSLIHCADGSLNTTDRVVEL